MTKITRKASQRRRESEDAKIAIPYTDFVERIQELEKRVAQLEQHSWSKLLRLPEAPKSKPGPKAKIPTDMLLQRRDALIRWLEDNWPELKLAIRRARKAE